MAERPANLPDYSNPPIDELAVGVQFPAVEGMHDAHVGLYWRMVREQYPRAETQPRVEAPIEALGPPQIEAPVIQFPLSSALQSRTWLINETDDYLIQIQNNRIVQNWRRREFAYPHFEQVWGRFIDNYGKFIGLLKSEDLPVPNVQQVEVTYINWISDILPSKFLKASESATISAYERTLEPASQTFTSRYDLNDDPIERLYVQCQPTLRAAAPNVQGSQLALVYRATRASGLTDEEISTYANSGRIIIVNAFTELTTAEAQRIWGRVVK